MGNLNVVAKTEEKKKIEVQEHLEFEGDMKTNIISSIAMTEIVSSLFAPVFKDYVGCKICINDGRGMPSVVNSMPYGALYVDLYFKDCGAVSEGDGLYKTVIPRGTNADGKKDLGSRFMAVNGAGNGRAYEITKDTYELLSDFTRAGSRTRWNECTQEISTPVGIYGGKEEVVVQISGLDLNKIITEIYGAKTKEARYEYIAMPSTIIPTKNQEFIMQVCQLDLAAVRELQSDLGIYSANAPQYHQYKA